MSANISKKNHEGYPDPTAYEALTKIQREERAKASSYRPLVYICSPFAGDIEQNILNARQYCRFAVGRGAVPFAPHLLYPQFMDDRDEEERSLGMDFGSIWLGKCDELWAFGGFHSQGMRQEMATACKRGVLIRFFNKQCEEVLAWP